MATQDNNIIQTSQSDVTDKVVFSERPVTKQENVSTVKVDRQPITVDSVRASLKTDPDGKSNRETAQLRQLTIRHYPSGKVGNDLQDGLYAAEDFNFQDRKVESYRMAFIDVPVGTTREMVKADIDRLYAKAKQDAQKRIAAGEEVDMNQVGPCIYQILDDEPILSDTQKQALKAGLIDINDVAFGKPDADGVRRGGQVVRYGENTSLPEGALPEHTIPSPAGNIQFRQTFFSKVFKEDIDRRTPAKSQGTRSFTAEEASEWNRTHITADQQAHEGAVTVSGSNESAAERKAKNARINDFVGTITQGERARRGLTGKPAARVGFEDNADMISDPDASQGSANEAEDLTTGVEGSSRKATPDERETKRESGSTRNQANAEGRGNKPEGGETSEGEA